MVIPMLVTVVVGVIKVAAMSLPLVVCDLDAFILVPAVTSDVVIPLNDTTVIS